MATKIKFEDAMQKLESYVSQLECGKMSLDDSLKSFEEAVKLVRICNERLESAEGKIRILTTGADGTVTDAPFADGENEA